MHPGLVAGWWRGLRAQTSLCSLRSHQGSPALAGGGAVLSGQPSVHWAHSVPTSSSLPTPPPLLPTGIGSAPLSSTLLFGSSWAVTPLDSEQICPSPPLYHGQRPHPGHLLPTARVPHSTLHIFLPWKGEGLRAAGPTALALGERIPGGVPRENVPPRGPTGPAPWEARELILKS